MKISEAYRSIPGESGAPPPSPEKRGGARRAASLILAIIIIMAALIVSYPLLPKIPYVSDALKQGYSLFQSLTGTQVETTTTGTIQPLTSSTTSGQGTQCSDVVKVGNLANPDIKNGSADVTYPSDYCTLAQYALEQINMDRAALGNGSVVLGFNQAAQQHADSMLYHGYFSHFDTQGLKPYMRYSMLNGRGADYENIAFNESRFTSTTDVESAIRALEHAMVYNDSACCNNGHRFNIEDKLHNVVSIGVAHNGTFVYFDEEFENDYINLSFSMTGASSATPYYVTMTGTPTASFGPPNSIWVAFDSTPVSQTAAALNSGPHEYGPGTLDGGVTPKNDAFGDCNQFTTGTTVCANTWKVTASQVDIEFSLNDFVKNYGPGVYTLYLIVGDSTFSSLTTLSVTVT